MRPLNKPKGNRKTFKRGTDAFWERRRAGLLKLRLQSLTTSILVRTLSNAKQKITQTQQAGIELVFKILNPPSEFPASLSESTRIISVILFFSFIRKIKQKAVINIVKQLIWLICFAYVCVERTHEMKMDTYLGKKSHRAEKISSIYVAKNRTYIFWNKRPTIASSRFAPSFLSRPTRSPLLADAVTTS